MRDFTMKYETEVTAKVDVDIWVIDQNGNDLTIGRVQRGSEPTQLEVSVDVPELGDKNFSVCDEDGNAYDITDISTPMSSEVDILIDVPQLENMNFLIKDQDGNVYDVKHISPFSDGTTTSTIEIEVPDKAYQYETAVKLLDKDGNALMEGGEAEISIGNPHTDQNPMEITLSEKAYKQIYAKMRKQIIQEVIENLFNENEAI